MLIHSVSKIGKEALEKKEGLLIGLSIRNSYFKDANLHELISWAKDRSKHIFIMCPDVPAIDTLRALGYQENKARQKAMLACNNLENKCKRIAEKLGIIDRMSFIRWDILEDHATYQKLHKALKNLYENDREFHQDVRKTTREVIAQHGTKLPITKAVDIGVDFFLKELAFIVGAANILNVPVSAYLYHKEMPVLDKLLQGRYNFNSPKNTGYIIAETDLAKKQLKGKKEEL